MLTTVEVVKPNRNETTLSAVAETEQFICYTSQSFKNSDGLWRTQKDESKDNPFSNVQKAKRREETRKILG